MDSRGNDAKIPSKSQANAPADFIHDNVTRMRGSENYWGDPITFDGDS